MDKVYYLLEKSINSTYTFLLALICLAMIIDVFSGTIIAKFKKEIQFKSKIGINGILKKIMAFTLLVFFIPICTIVPDNLGNGFLYTMYTGYLLMEVQSILENYKKIGIDTSHFEELQKKIKEALKIDKK